MTASLRALLSGAIDYAGLFPPAALPLDQAIRNYARYRREADAWMLGRFVIPAARLHELESFADLFQEGPPFPLSLLGRGGEDAAHFLRGFSADFQVVKDLSARFGAAVKAEVFDVRLPQGCAFAGLTAEAVGLTREKWTLFFEGPPAGNEVKTLLAAYAQIAECRTEQDAAYAVSGYKLRCGGLTASAFPSVEQVAFVLRACRNAGVPMKFTAGLHHPLRRYDVGLQTHMHGFLNVFTAGVLAHARRTGEAELRTLLADEDPASFVFTDDGLRWKDWRASTAEIVAARTDFVTSFGSCSFDEPRDDLRALGWM